MTEPTDREMMRSLCAKQGMSDEAIDNLIEQCERYAHATGIDSIGQLRAEDFDAIVRQLANEAAAAKAYMDQLDALGAEARCPCQPAIYRPQGVPLSTVEVGDIRIRHQPGCPAQPGS